MEREEMDEAIVERTKGGTNLETNLLKECQLADTPSGGNQTKARTGSCKRVELFKIRRVFQYELASVDYSVSSISFPIGRSVLVIKFVLFLSENKNT